jgi:hypothetical protein
MADLLNCAQIIVYPRRFVVTPACPIVRAAYEPFLVGIDWDNADDAWESATVQGFTNAAGGAVATDPASVTFLRSQGNIVRPINFLHTVSADAFCKYEIVYQGADPGDELVFDPTLMLKKGVGPGPSSS